MGTQKNCLGSFEHPKHMFKFMDKEINAILGAQTLLIWTFASRIGQHTQQGFS